MSTSKETEYYFRLAKEYQSAKDASDVFKKRAEKMRTELVQAVNELGYEDDKHHRWMESEDLQIKYERRVSKRLDLEAVETWARDQGLWDDVKDVVEVVNEDKLMALAWDNPEIQKVVQSLYVETENYALKVIDV
jgi:hypothetical protein